MLLGNRSVLTKSHARFSNGTATTGAYAANTKSNWINPSIYRSRTFFWSGSQSFPSGYNITEAISPALSAGELASQTNIAGSGSISATLWEVKLSEATLSGSGSITEANLASLVPSAATLAGSGDVSQAALAAVSSLAATLGGTCSISAELSALVPLAATLSGSGDIAGTTNMTGIGRLEASITPYTELSPESLAESVWSAIAASNNDAGTMGEKLNDAGSAGNPWAALLDDNNDAGTFGERVQKLITVAKFLGLK